MALAGQRRSDPGLRRVGKVARIAGVVVGAVVALVLLVGAAAWLFVTSARGSEVARRWLVTKANTQLAGQLSLDRLGLAGSRLNLDGLTLRDPDGVPVVRVDKIDVRFSPWALLRGRVHIRSLVIDRPAVWLVQSQRGLNLSRAIAARNPSATTRGAGAPDTSPGGGGPTVRLDQLELAHGTAELRLESSTEPARVFRASGLTVASSATYEPGTPGVAFDGILQARGELTAPFSGELSIDANASGRGAERKGRVKVAAAGARADAVLETHDRDRLAVSLERLLIPASLVLALVPDAPLQPAAALDVRGTLSRSGDHASIDARISAAGGELAAKGQLDLSRMRTEGDDGVTVSARRLDLSALLRGTPKSDLAFDLQARGGGRDLASANGDLSLRVPVGRVGGRALGPVRLAVEVRPGNTTLADLVAELPGVKLTGSGHLAAGALDLRARIEASNLADTLRSLAAPGEPPLVALAGRGRAEVAVGGTLARPSLRVEGAFPKLAVETNRFDGLTVRAFTPDLRRPAVSDIEIHARSAELGGRLFRRPSVIVRAAGNSASAKILVAGPQPLALTLAGRWLAPSATKAPPSSPRGGGPPASRHAPDQEVRVDSLTLRFPEGEWRLAHPARVAFGAGHLWLRNVALEGGNQTITADVVQDGQALRGNVAVSRLDLARLPRALLPPRLTLSGLLTFDARLKKRARGRPEIALSLALADARIGSYRHLTVNVEANADGRRAQGHLDARGLGTSVRGRFDLPVTWPPRDRRAPLELEIDFAETDLALAMKAIGDARDEASLPGTGPVSPSAASLPDLRGRARLSLHVRGSLEDPHLELSAAARGLVVDRRPVGDLDLALAGDGDKPLDLNLRFAAAPLANVGSGSGSGNASGSGAGRGSVQIRASQSLASFMGPLMQPSSRPVSTSPLLRTRFEVGAEIDSLPLAIVARLAGYRPAVGGTLALHVDLTGTAQAPRGRIAIDVASATTGRFPATDGRLVATLDERSTTAHIEIDRKRKRLLEVDARLQAAVTAAFRNPAALVDAALHLQATLNPLQMQRAGLPPQTDRDPPRMLKGLLGATLTVDGSVRAPVADLRIEAADVRLDKILVGEAHIGATYRAGQAQIDARLFSANRGSMRIEATTRLALGYPAVLRGVDVDRLPLTIRARAQGFDVQGFSGITPGLRKLAGLIFAEAAVDGTVADPRLSGRLEWKEGGLAVTGYGEYRDVHLSLHGDQQNLVLDDLRVASGGGHAHATATATHVPGQGYRYTARADVNKFPVYSQGQELATVSVDVSAHGTASPIKVGSVLEIKESHVALSDAKKREVQSLNRPGDVVLVQEGQPLNRAQAEKLRQLAAAAKARPVLTSPSQGRGAVAGPPVAGAAPSPPAVTVPPATGPREIHIRVEAPRNVWVTGKDANLELGLTPPFRITMDERPLVFGEVRVLRGRVDVFGRRFDIKQPSTVLFNGSPDTPEVDLQAEYVNETVNVTVTVTAKGRLDHLKVAVTSPNRPDLGESQLYTLIITGRLQLGGGGASSATPTEQAASLMGGLLAAQLQKTLANKLPLDVLTIDAGGSGLTGTQLEAGTYLTNKLYLGYVGRVGADPMRYQNRNAVHLEYEFTSRWSFDGEYGDVGTGSADLMWKKNY